MERYGGIYGPRISTTATRISIRNQFDLPRPTGDDE